MKYWRKSDGNCNKIWMLLMIRIVVYYLLSLWGLQKCVLLWWYNSYQCYILNYTLMTILSVMQQLVHNCASKKNNEKLLYSYWLNLYIRQLIGCLLNKILQCCGNEFIIGILREKIQRPKNGETFNMWITCIWQEF